jgi:DNA replication protein DnaC
MVRRAKVTRRHFDEDAMRPEFWKSPSGADIIGTASPHQRAVYDDIAASPRGSLFALVGRRGCGKTQIGMACIIDRCAAATFGTGDPTPGRTCARYARAMEFFDDLKASYKPDGASGAAVVAAYLEPALLVLDDTQDRGETDWEQRMLAHLIDKRYGAMRDTIMIANIAPGEFHGHVGAAISDRIRECGGVIECDWESFRGAT